jgi:hypothetical protein
MACAEAVDGAAREAAASAAGSASESVYEKVRDNAGRHEIDFDMEPSSQWIGFRIGES